ncbi:MAG TPA: hypothetical protein VEB86_18010 [Chryseosolibacter sp.]|nr:hypothetical protein [Chryseosolibacter sp.]
MKTMTSVDDHILAELQHHFEQKNAADFVSVLETNSVGPFLRITSDEEAEVAMMSAFCYFSLDQFAETLKFSMPLVIRLETTGATTVAAPLYTEMVGITISSLMKLNRPFKAYRFMKKRTEALAGQTSDYGAMQVTVREKLAALIRRYAGYLFTGITALVIIGRHVFGYASREPYILTLLILLTVLLCIQFMPGWVQRQIHRIL